MKCDRYIKHYRDDINRLLDHNLKKGFIEKFGDETYQHYLCTWLIEAAVFERGEIKTYIIKATKI